MNIAQLCYITKCIPETATEVVIKDRKGLELFFTTKKAITAKTLKNASSWGIAITSTTMPPIYGGGFRFRAKLEVSRKLEQS